MRESAHVCLTPALHSSEALQHACSQQGNTSIEIDGLQQLVTVLRFSRSGWGNVPRLLAEVADTRPTLLRQGC